jgi:energy-coupling factor transporter transmembrane protein EcfT
MINTLAQIDYLASAGKSPWHRASALAKLLLAALAIGLAIAAPRLPLQLALYGAALLLLLTSALPFRLLAEAAGYPLLFVTFVVAVRWDGTIATPLSIALRPLTATALAVWLVGTTPYPDLFAPISRLLPRAIGDGLFLTYRALFDFLLRTERLSRAMHLRGGDRLPLRRRLAAAGEGLGTLVLHGFERSEHVVAIMQLRGHSGRVCGCRHWAEWTAADVWVALAGAAVLAAAFALWGRA